MAIRSGFFNSVNGDRKYDASKFAEYFASFIGNGVFPNPSDNLQVISNNNMTVTIRPGKAWINGYILINDDDYVLTLDPADGVLSRIDRVVVRYDVADREIRLEVKKGQFSSQPVAPELQRDADAYELGLADIYVKAGAVSIGQANITDLRMNSAYCGIVAGTVNQIDTTNLFAQYQAAFEEWFQELKDVLDDNTAANLLNLINQLDDDLTSHKEDNTAHGVNTKVPMTRTVNGKALSSNITLSAEDVGALSKNPSLVFVSSSKTLALTDEAKVLNCTNSSAITITIPANSSVAFPIGTEIAIIRSGTGDVTISPASGVTLNSDGGKRKIKSQYTSVALKKIATDTWVLVGALSS